MTLENKGEKESNVTSEEIAVALSEAEIDPVAAEKVATGEISDKDAVLEAETKLEEGDMEADAAGEDDSVYEETGIIQSFRNLVQAAKNFFHHEVAFCREIIMVRVKRIVKAAIALILAAAFAIIGLVGLLVGVFIALIHAVGALGAGLIFAGVGLPIAIILVLVAYYWLTKTS
ncbi:MAG: hypothetical protein ABF760_02620 [Zymomonas mobilis]|uniref:Uncharacterized protein n=1 Tax=Zymomonas mobilis TaxID=542 RepID=A0A542W2W9_ZYMMB|nr:hypothetical protein [Zymomonas mobilis]TQL17917.1 hypothetical protein FBY58_1530 [Zymomonas mobilis]